MTQNDYLSTIEPTKRAEMETIRDMMIQVAPDWERYMVRDIMAVLARLREGGMSILLVEQNVAQSLDLAQRAYVLENGSVRFEGPSADLLASDALRCAYLGM